MDHLLQIFEQGRSGLELDEAFSQALGTVVPLREIVIFRYDEKAHRLVCRFAPGLTEGERQTLGYALGEDLCGTALLAGQPVSSFGARQRESGNEPPRRVALPLTQGNRHLGALEIYRRGEDEGFSPEDLIRARTAAMLYAQALALEEVRTLGDQGRAPAAERAAPGGALGESSAYRRTQRLLLRAAPGNAPVLILGESGTGKELCARQIHASSPRGGKPLVVVNCASLSDAHLESELFGHSRGAFTGAIRERRGKLREAEGGSLFLDEVAELTPACQAKLLRTLDSAEIAPLGSDKTYRVNVRFIAATNRPLAELVERGAFRADLLFRLRGMQIELPPLRDRRGDLDILMTHFLREEAAARGAPARRFDGETVALLRAYPWPGNIRELRQVIASSVAMAEGDEIRATDLPRVLREWNLSRPVPVPLPIPVSVSPEEREERDRIVEALRQTAYPTTGRWNLSAAARSLGLTRSAIEYRIRTVHRIEEV